MRIRTKTAATMRRPDPTNRTIPTYSWGETEQQEHEGVLDANGRLTVTLPTAVDGKHEDQDYRIEARVTDAANREVSGHSTVLATYGSFRVSVEPTSYVFAERTAGAREGDGAGLRRQAGADAGAHGRGAGEVGLSDAPADGDARGQQRCRDRRGWNGAGGSAA